MYNNKFKEVKDPTSYIKQLNLLKSRGMLIDNDDKVLNILSQLNYYTISGYLQYFKIDNDNYINGLTFEKIYKIYEFDKRFRNIMQYAIETIEKTLKTKLADTLAFNKNFGKLGYLNVNNFKKPKEHSIFLNNFKHQVRDNKKLDFVKHHNNTYGGLFPIWVASELFTMGMIYNLYINLNTNYQKLIAKKYSTGVDQLSSWIGNIKYIRNIVAHYMRLYNFKLQMTPKKCDINFDTNFKPSYKIFDIIYIMKFMMFDKDEWNNYIIPNLKALIQEYEPFVILNDIGFPVNWEILLKKI